MRCCVLAMCHNCSRLHTYIIPLLKKANLDSSLVKNCRSIFNLPVMSKCCLSASSRWLQCAVHSGSQSSFDNTAFRVRQGSVLGPLLLLYMVDLVSTIQKHGLHLHLFTDDMQMYGWCWPNEITLTSLLDVTRLCA